MEHKNTTHHLEKVQTQMTANTSEPPVTPRPSQPKLTAYIIFFACYISIAAAISAFDLGYGGTVLNMAPFEAAYGKCIYKPNAAGQVVHICTVTALQQSLISLTLLFAAIGGATSGVIGRYLGRRGTLQVGSFLIAVGAGSMLGTAGNYTAYLACKCIGGVGIGQIIAGATAYGAECIPAHHRGALMACYNVGLGWGNAVVAAVCLGSSKYTSNLAWQIPIICQIPLSLLLGFGVLIFPESPRWLLVRGQEEKARRSFARFYGLDPADQIVMLQMQDVQHHIELEKAFLTTTNWIEIFHPAQLRRTLTSALCLVSVAICGGKFVVPYAAIFLTGVGISNVYLVNFILAACIAGAGLFSPLMIDSLGRRICMLTGFGLQAIFMLIVSAVGSALGSGTRTAKLVLVVFFCLWGACFGSLVGVSVWTTAPELHSIRLRTYGQAFSTVCYEVFGFAASFYAPYMVNVSYGNMGLNVGYFYFGVTILIWAFLFLLVPETSRLSLEQIDDYFFSGRRAWRTGIRRNNKIPRGEVLDPSEQDFDREKEIANQVV